MIFGQRDYSMRVWLDPDRLAAASMTAGDVVESLREQNVQVAAGQIGQQPAAKGVDFQYTMTTLGRLTEPEQFADIIVKTGADGQVIRLRDVGRVELGAKNQDINNYLDGMPADGHGRLPIARLQRPGDGRARQGENGGAEDSDFPKGVDYRIVLRHHALHQRIDPRGVSYAAATPCCWWRSWCWCSCRTGVPR